VAYHALVHVLDRLGPGQLIIRYEDLVSYPGKQLVAATAFLGERITSADLSFLDGDRADLKVNHTIAGSLVRLQHGPVRITPDDEWKTALSQRDRRAVTLATWPLLRRYGYLASNGKNELFQGLSSPRS
jgi:hypothetical protein